MKATTQTPAEFVQYLLGITGGSLQEWQVLAIDQTLKHKVDEVTVKVVNVSSEPVKAGTVVAAAEPTLFGKGATPANSEVIVPKTRDSRVNVTTCAAVLNLNAADRTNPQIASETGLTEGVVSKILRANNRYPFRRRNGNLDDDARSTIAELARAGCGLGQIVKETGWSKSTITKVLVPLGLYVDGAVTRGAS